MCEDTVDVLAADGNRRAYGQSLAAKIMPHENLSSIRDWGDGLPLGDPQLGEQRGGQKRPGRDKMLGVGL